MIQYPKIENLKEYRDKDCLSQSFLKQVLQGSTKEFKETVPMVIGSVLDSLLSCPDLTDSLFHVGLSKRPSDAIQKIVDSLLNSIAFTEEPVKPFEEYKDYLINMARIYEYQNKWGDDALWESIKKSGEEYFFEKINSSGKTIVTQEEWELSQTIAILTKMNSITGKYFIDHENTELYFQKDLYWKIGEHSCKGLLDLLIIEHETKTIYYIDFKGTSVSAIEQWFQICKEKNYPFQMAWYIEGIRQNFSELISKGYKIQMRWMVLPFNTVKFHPWIIPVTQEMLWIGKYGAMYSKHLTIGKVDTKSFYRKKGWLDALSILEYSKENGLVDFDVLWHQNQGKMSDSVANELFL